ncbi:hypothetical protein NP493_1526g00020 [Ridgeia piscesae]|uniref:Uncharacterized protein n=1 Tax=Ridgeia piscesae TaxID=27915 RepID=A0AAD9NCP7_RIDPI|nr:hypothetical protein NP493_1526g00020 [Ridgeia piscesae]
MPLVQKKQHFEPVTFRPAPPFCAIQRSAAGQSEMWKHLNDRDIKFQQFGWRCTNSESLYRTGVLIGNWSEERSDLNELRKAKRLPSQYSHYYETIHDTDYNIPGEKIPEELRHMKAKFPHAFPHHQPVLDSQQIKDVYNSFETTSRQAFVDPRVRKEPVGCPPEEKEPICECPPEPQ